MVANILPPDPPSTAGFKRSNFKISEHGHVAYPIKWNHECNHMVTHICMQNHPPRPWESKGQNSNFFQNMVMLHINLKKITNTSTR